LGLKKNPVNVKLSDQQFRFGIAAADAAHVIAAGLFIMHIGHAVKISSYTVMPDWISEKKIVT
jgi:hypothetical protein